MVLLIYIVWNRGLSIRVMGWRLAEIRRSVRSNLSFRQLKQLLLRRKQVSEQPLRASS